MWYIKRTINIIINYYKFHIMANTVKRILVKDFNNKELEIVLLFRDNKLSLVQCPANVRLENFLKKIVEYINESDLVETVKYYFRNNSDKIDELIIRWMSMRSIKDFADVKKKFSKRAVGCVYANKLPPYDKLVYILGHYKACRGITLNYDSSSAETPKVTLTLSLNCRVTEVYHADIINNNVEAAKNKAAQEILKRLGF